MKQDKARKVISFVIAVLFSLSGLLVLFPVSVFAESSVTLNLVWHNFPSVQYCTLWNMNSSSVVSETRYSLPTSWVFPLGVSLQISVSTYANNGSYSYFSISDFTNAYGGSSYPLNYVLDGDTLEIYYISAVVSSDDLRRFRFSLAVGSPATPTPTPTPTPTATPSPTPSLTPSVDTFYQPFDSFAGTYYNGQALTFPNSVTKHQYQQYSGIVSDNNMTITDIRTSVQYSGDYVVYRFDYDILPLASDDFRFDFLYEADSELPTVYVSYTLNGQAYESDDFEQSYLTGIYSQFGAYDIDPSQSLGPPYYEWDVDLTSQRTLAVEIEGLTSSTPLTVTLYISSSPMPSIGSAFDWAQLFQDTRPDSVFLTTVSSISALPFFLGGLGFLALGAVIGIVLKFMR